MSVRFGTTLFSAVFIVISLAGCSSDSGSSGGQGGSGGAGVGGSAGAPAGGSAGAGTGGVAGAPSGGAGGISGAGGLAGGAGTGGVAGAGGTSGAGAGSANLALLGALVVLGDSMSDGGGVPPFYYDTLRQDLITKYGQITYKNNAQSGSKTGALVGQIDGLPGTLPGPVAVCITSGGNDMKADIMAIVTGTDGPARAQMGANISAALGKLLEPNHFGAGVQVQVFEANIYDASDGQGNFSANNCAFGKGLPAIPTDGFFANWNGEIATQVSAKAQYLSDIHELFRMHGFNYPPSWYASDCTHPNATGHDQLRRNFYWQITGQKLP